MLEKRLGQRAWLIATAFSILFSLPSQAQLDLPNADDNLGRGFDPTKIYSVADVDQINTFNGNLVISIPIGQRYSTGGSFSYGLQLVYNSTNWHFDHRLDPQAQSCSFDEEDKGRQATRAFPGLEFNAGLGWRINPGQLWGPNPPDGSPSPPATEPPAPNERRGGWTYVGPDGAEHAFSRGLNSSPLPNQDPDPGVRYTNDSSFLRLFGNEGDSAVRVEFPDGSVHHFELADVETREYRLTLIRDRHDIVSPGQGNFLRVRYELNPVTQLVDWIFEDSVGRSHSIVFQAPELGNSYDRLIDYIKVAAFGSATAVFDFDYIYPEIPRPCAHEHSAVPLAVTVPLLSEIRLPDPDGMTGPLSWLSYFPEYNTSGALFDCDKAGKLVGLVLPTGNKIEWEYGLYSFPNPANCVTATSPPCTDPASTNYGVSARVILEPAAAGAWQEVGRWTYHQNFPWEVVHGNNCFHPIPSRTIVTNPLGNLTPANPSDHQTIHYYTMFSRFSTLQSDPLIGADYGMPYVRNHSVDGTADPHFLSTEQFNEDGVLDRTTYVRYAMDDDLLGHNQRLVSSRTVYETDGGHFTQTTRSRYDGLGNHRRVETKGSFDSGLQRTETAYNPGRGVFCGATVNVNAGPLQQVDFFCDNSSEPWIAPTPADPWILGTFDLRRVTNGGTQTTRHCFDPTTGDLLAKRTLASTGLAQDAVVDLLTVFDYDEAGNVVAERHYGGDTQAVTAGLFSYASFGACSLAPGLPSHAAYRIQRSYSFGSLAKEGFVDECKCPLGVCSISLAYERAGLALLTADHTIDPNTGLVSQSRDSAGVLTTFDYDLLGRLSKATPAQTAPLNYSYNSAFPLQVKETRGTTALTERRLEFDGLGQVVEERTRVPRPGSPSLDDFVVQRTAYDPLGRVVTQSERAVTPRACGTLQSPGPCTFFTYDAFGRPTETRAPDGTVAQTSYTGVRQIARTVEVDGVSATTTETYDPFGRLVQVSEPSGAGGALTTTLYGYNQSDRLTSVTIGGSVDQKRVFVYDGRGFLLSESHPELGFRPDGAPQEQRKVLLSQYDVLGNVGARTVEDGPALSFAYDRAGRPTQVRDGLGSLLKELFYAPQHVAAPDFSEGKLVMAKRHNSIADPENTSQTMDVVVTESFTYDGTEGRVSRIRTRSSLGFSTVHDYEYDSLGLLAAVTYPRCDRPPCGLAGSGRRVVHSFNEGLLIGIDEDSSTSYPLAKSIAYHHNGLLARVEHGNDVVDRQTLDPSGMLRPRSLRASFGATNLWSSGNYAYDGAGNITAIGPNVYDYDRVSRLTRGTVDVPGAASAPEQVVSYDVFGNILSLTTGGQSEPIAVDPLTNRLTMSGTCYDAAGNVTQWSATPGAQTGTCVPETGYRYSWDDLNRMIRAVWGGVNRSFLYDSSDNRIASYDYMTDDLHWTPRGRGNKILAAFRWSLDDGVVEHEKDYVYRGGALLASLRGEVHDPAHEERHYHLDHLGSTRLVTEGTGQTSGSVLAEYRYFPFGSLAYHVGAGERFLFTGHERDLSPGGARGDLDYMLARHYSPVVGRFLGVDPTGKSISPSAPLSWHRYAYVTNNPLRFFDPEGTAGRNFHHNLTKDLALLTYFSPSEAQAIAEYTSAPDDDFRNPFLNFFLDLGSPFMTLLVGGGLSAGQNEVFHFASPETLDDLWNAAVGERSLRGLGTFLHAFQDSEFFHKPFVQDGNSPLPSFHLTTSTDKVCCDPRGGPRQVALEAAVATYEVLIAWRKIMGLEVPGDDDKARRQIYRLVSRVADEE